MSTWPRMLLITVAVLVPATAFILWLAARRWDRATDTVRRRLLASRRPLRAHTFLARELDGLPSPVVRYFQLALRDGQRIVTQARITWAGEFNMGSPGADRWAPLAAVQDFVPGAGGMVWDARIALAPGVPVRVRDAVVDDAGSMRAAVLGLVVVVNARPSAGLTAAALQRYLSELAWVPTALLPSQGVMWTPIDATRARATLQSGTTVTSVDFVFADNGLVESMYVPERVYDDGKHPASVHPWQGRCLASMSHDGMMVPAEAVAEWLLPRGTYTYWRARALSIQYDYAPR